MSTTKSVEIGSKVEVTYGTVRWIAGEVRGLDIEHIIARVVLEDGRTVYVRSDLRPCNASPEVKRVRMAA
jgi:hypothetical protein